MCKATSSPTYDDSPGTDSSKLLSRAERSASSKEPAIAFLSPGFFGRSVTIVTTFPEKTFDFCRHVCASTRSRPPPPPHPTRLSVSGPYFYHGCLLRRRCLGLVVAAQNIDASRAVDWQKSRGARTVCQQRTQALSTRLQTGCVLCAWQASNVEDPALNVEPAAAVLLQASMRRLLVRARKARLVQRREVLRRRRARNAHLTSEAFAVSGSDMLSGLHKHTEEGIQHTSDQMPPPRKSVLVRHMGQWCKRLLDTLESVQKLACAPNDAAACDEMSLLLCELLQGSQCDVFQVDATEGHSILKVNQKVFINARSHGLLHGVDYSFDGPKGGKPITLSNLDLHSDRAGAARDADKDDSVGVLEWYEARYGTRELLLRSTEQDRVAATMRACPRSPLLPASLPLIARCSQPCMDPGRAPRAGERGFKTTRANYRLKEYGHAMIIPVWAHPRRTSLVRNGHGESDDGEVAGEPTLVALVQLLRLPDQETFSADEEYLAAILAPHLEAALRRSRLLGGVQSQVGKMAKLHAWAGSCKLESPDDLCGIAASLFPADDVALYAILPEDDANASQAARRKKGRNSSDSDGDSSKLTPVRKGATTSIDSVNGLETLCTSGQCLAISQGGGAKGFDSLLSLLRRPLCAATRSMLCVPAFVHFEVLKLDRPSDPTEEASVVPCVLQWANAHGRPFGRSDMLVASAFSDVLGRLASHRSLKASQAVLQERFREGDLRRNALMESARMLANRMEMEELFAAVMLHAKDLMEVDRSTLFMVDKSRENMFTIVADGAAPINIPVGKGLAGAAYSSGKLVNIADAYNDDRFNRDIDAASGYRTKSVLCYPIHNSRDEVIAVIQLINKLSGVSFTAADEELVGAFCAQLAVSIENILAIEDMNQSQRIASEQKQRMFGFLDVVRGILRGLPAHEVCVNAQRAAMDCTGSSGAAIFICPDNAPDVLSAARVDLDDVGDSETDDAAAGDRARASAHRELSPSGADVELVQLVPPLLEGMWPAVARFSSSVVAANGTLEDEVDINDNGLPEALRLSTKPKMVRCMATPLSIANGGDEGGIPDGAPRKTLGVIAVWGGRHEYTPADQQVLGTLAVLASHLLITTDAAKQADEMLAKQREALRTMDEQLNSMVRFASQLGTPTPQALHDVAHRLHRPLNCAACTLWLVQTEPGQPEQRMVTQLPADGKVLLGIDESVNPDGGSSGSGVVTVSTSNDGAKQVGVPMSGAGILGHVASTAKPLRVPDAHTHHAYSPEVDEAACRLDEEYTAICVAPIVDYTGRVLGVLQASAKQPAQITATSEQPGLWERDIFENLGFSSGDQNFLMLIADRMAQQLQLLSLTGRSPTEVVDQQAIATQLQAQVGSIQEELLARRRNMHTIHTTSVRSYGGPAERGNRRPLPRPPSLTAAGDGSFGGVRLPAVERPRKQLSGAQQDLGLPRARRGALSQPELRDRAKLDPPGPKLTLLDHRAQQEYETSSSLPASVDSPRSRSAINTPDAIWEELCRTLREL